MGVDGGVGRDGEGGLQFRFTGEGQDAEGAGVVGHGGVGVYAVAHHRDFVRLQAVAVADAV